MSERNNVGINCYHTAAPWFRDYFGEYDTANTLESDKPCRHCGKGKAVAAPCYQGLCHSCWTDLVFYCMEWAARWIDKHPDRWRGDERPDPLQLAIHRIRVRIERGTFDDLLTVAIDGADPKELAKKRKRLEINHRSYRRHKETKIEYNRRYNQAHREKAQEWHRKANRAYYARNREKCIADHRSWVERNREKYLEYQREYSRNRRKKQVKQQQQETQQP